MSANLTTFTPPNPPNPPNPLNTAVLFLVFNRLDTTKQVFEAIRLAKPPRLYIAADGARASRAGEAATVQAVRDYVVSHIDWECEVKTLFRVENLGCKIGVSGGIDWFFQNEEEGIILEDDVVPHPDFFAFCELILENYRDDERVMMATGTNYLSAPNLEDPYFFTQHYTIWGWATWRRAWKYYDVAMTAWDKKKVKNDIQYKFNESFIGTHFRETFDSLKTSYVDTWDIQWVFTCLYNSGLCATPRVNLISNIGVEGVHVSGVTDSHYLKTDFLRLEEGFGRALPVTVNSYYDAALHELKTRPALRKLRAVSILKKLRLFYPVRSLFRTVRKMLKQ